MALDEAPLQAGGKQSQRQAGNILDPSTILEDTIAQPCVKSKLNFLQESSQDQEMTTTKVLGERDNFIVLARATLCGSTLAEAVSRQLYGFGRRSLIAKTQCQCRQWSSERASRRQFAGLWV